MALYNLKYTHEIKYFSPLLLKSVARLMHWLVPLKSKQLSCFKCVQTTALTCKYKYFQELAFFFKNQRNCFGMGSEVRDPGLEHLRMLLLLSALFLGKSQQIGKHSYRRHLDMSISSFCEKRQSIFLQ